MDTPKLKINNKFIGLRTLGQNTFEPKNIQVLGTAIDGSISTTKPLVVVAYFQNEESTVEGILQSIDNKMAGEKWSLLAIDNGSADNTYDVISKYSSKADTYIHARTNRITNKQAFEAICYRYAQPLTHGDNRFITLIENSKVQFEHNTISSFCIVGTEEVKKELALNIFSIRCYHSEPIYIVCDTPTQKYIQHKFDCSNIFFDVSANPEQLEAIRSKYKTEFSKLENGLHRLDCILLKMRVIDIALQNQSNTLFLDSDIILANKLDMPLYNDVVISPHYWSTSSKFGPYNAGYVFCNNKELPKAWRRLFLEDSKFCEQECMSRFNELFDTGIFNEQHNIGFWRKFDSSIQPYSFHTHLFGIPGDRRDPTTSKQQEHMKAVVDYFNQSDDKIHTEIYNAIKLIYKETDQEVILPDVNGKYLTTSWAHTCMGTPIISNDTGKIKLIKPTTFQSHRSGWNYAIDAIVPLHNDRGVLFDGFLENQFGWTEKRKQYPYNEPWVGIFHNPPNIPDWFFSEYNPEALINNGNFQRSLETCKGIYTLSNYHADTIRKLIPSDIPINVLIHPTEIPSNLFDYEKFVENTDKKIINIGYWLRRLTSIYTLPINSYYTKCRLMPYDAAGPKKVISKLFNEEIKRNNVVWNEYFDHTVTLDRVSNSEYDRLLSENIIFLDLYDSSANNAVIECIARGTPILINPLPAVVEYLGDRYPFYFNDLDEAADKARNFDLIKDTNEYLLNCSTRKKLTQQYFRQSLINSEIYSSL